MPLTTTVTWTLPPNFWTELENCICNCNCCDCTPVVPPFASKIDDKDLVSRFILNKKLQQVYKKKAKVF